MDEGPEYIVLQKHVNGQVYEEVPKVTNQNHDEM